MVAMTDPDDISLLCHRCGTELTPGKGDFYVVRIEAVADPSPPNISEADFAELDLDEAVRRTIEELRGLSEQEIMDQVYRRLTIHLCRRCYTKWIEDPAG